MSGSRLRRRAGLVAILVGALLLPWVAAERRVALSSSDDSFACVYGHKSPRKCHSCLGLGSVWKLQCRRCNGRGMCDACWLEQCYKNVAELEAPSMSRFDFYPGERLEKVLKDLERMDDATREMILPPQPEVPRSPEDCAER